MDLIRHSAVRDLRVDFFRGLALWWIYTDHIPGDVLGDFSLRNFAMCDATEVFVLLAGYGAGLSYGNGLGRNGYISTAADVMKRAWTLYIAHIFLFVLFTAQVTYSATALNRLNYLEETRLDVLGDDPYRSMLEALLLRFQPSLLNILPLYVVLLVFLAATIWLLRWPQAAVRLLSRRLRPGAPDQPQPRRVGWRRLVLRPARLAVPVHHRCPAGLRANAPAQATMAARRRRTGGGGRSAWWSRW